ncbi:hypothetical protein GSI_01645 [Ganoderma sinense ZZ0214-1]|uniref:Protein kinase domain-containing protein n=1 Tax=Ganoderma sinense ZZ0214-1 TaxID=1077348 RepID=A0A2G8SQE5_9APHY|nr:hypothetical protein GSI_01645 [Ganoderma sinense ZZ0214-1]
MDATRTSDKETVLMKRVNTTVHPYELEIAQYFSTGPISADPRNHCCPIYEVLQDPTDENTIIMVMPHLRRYINPEFQTIGEAMEFFRQVFEGLQFIHEHHVAHRDCMTLNIMMDARPMYPNGFHPRDTFLTPDYSRFAKYYSRTRRPVKYYFTDFGISRKFEENDTNPTALPILSADRTIPEYQEDNTSARNPFPTDVYLLGNVIRKDFLEKYSNLAFMEPLIETMVSGDPTSRSTMPEVVERFRTVLANLSRWQLRARLVLSEDDGLDNALKDLHYLYFRLIPRFLLRIPPMPTPKA